MASPLHCSHCAAPVQDARATSCPYCGTVLAPPAADPLRAVVAPERFAAAERASGYAALLRHTPSETRVLFGLGCATVFLLGWIAMAVGMTVLFLPAGPMALVPGGMAVLGVVLLVTHSSRAVGFARAPLERRLLVWRDERTEVDGGGKHRSATTTHFALLEDRDGRRLEVSCDERLAGAHAPGDIGIAFLRAGVLLDFRRVEG